VSVKLSKKQDPIAGNATQAFVFVEVPTTGCTWEAKSDSEWIAVTATARSGGGQVEYAVQANPLGGSERSGTIIIGGEKLTIVQGPAAGSSPPADSGGGDGGGDGSGGGGGGGGDGSGGGDSGG
ncbi:MAG: BACON domain-containing carbohydrate-binding protein, partial [Casimicrobiaceae bacterium]